LPEKTQQKTGLHLLFKELLFPEGAGLRPATCRATWFFFALIGMGAIRTHLYE
jgi:hypothetical protein